MSGQQWGTVIGGAIGAYFGMGNPAAIQLGMAIGPAVGEIADPRDCRLPVMYWAPPVPEENKP